ncbi:guanylate cyclase soluble subunit beta-1-like [Dermacentor andersoni]|uniref:guanylate cyclase soluble subunit beta-1-like n=1 Tax=Dermacentor andersoni TaxID=34620 RepID=UPI002155157C|nr:guanylate cyclase soluble subunit beta-1-like [Dermacentor andersoni]
MYGFIHCALEDLVTKKFGAETWKMLLKKSGIAMHGASFLMHKVYTDEMTLKLVAAACEVLGLDLDTCLEAFGEHFLYFCQQHGYDHILRVLGSNMADFLTNLDNLHDHLASTYPGMRAPSFRVTPGPSGQILLHYYSDRKGLHPIVLGIVKVVGREFFNTEVRANISVVSEFGDRAHVTMEVTEQNKEGKSCLLPSNASETLSNCPEDLPMGVRTMCVAFPFHVLFGRDFGIMQAGNGLLRLAGHRWKESRAQGGQRLKFDDIFEITRPVIDCTFESIRSYCNQVFVVQTKEGVLKPRGSNNSEVDGGDSSTSPPVLRLKGQMVSVEETQSILFLCSPRVKDIDDMRRIGLFFSDLAIHDPARELFLRSHHHRGERELIEKLDEATNRLRMLQSKLDEDKKRTEELLHSILPSKVAMRLCQNLPVEAEKFETVSCLFSDIVGFTNMCGSCAPMDIVRLLNKLYLQFDNLSNVHGVYKVETIGDAYVVVAGVPDFVEDHADRLVAMGLDMITATKSVLNPVSGEPIQMRIGVHTGYATAGVVGKTMPRYCLFGNTVTLANKTESLSKPSRVNVTEVARSHLTKKDYVFEDNPDVGDFPLRCYLVVMASRPNAEAQPTAAGEQPADDSMLLSPSSSPIRRSSAVTSPSFDVDEIGLFIKSRLNCTDADVDATGTQQRKKNDDESLLAALHEATYSQANPDTADSGNVTIAEDLQTPPVPSASSTTGLIEDAAARHSAVSSTERRASYTLGIETDASKPAAGSKSSFFGFSWSLPQGSKQKKVDMHSSRSASPQAIREDRGDCAGKAHATESVGADAGRQHCPFFRFRSKGAGRQEELADSGRCSQTAGAEVEPTAGTEGRVSGGQLDRTPNSPSTSHRETDVRRKEKFWSRVIFPS